MDVRTTMLPIRAHAQKAWNWATIYTHVLVGEIKICSFPFNSSGFQILPVHIYAFSMQLYADFQL